MSFLPRFRLSMAPLQGIAAGPSAPPSQLCLDLGIEPGNKGIAGPRNSQTVGIAGPGMLCLDLGIEPGNKEISGPSTPPSQLCLDFGIPGNEGITGPCNSPSVGIAGTPEDTSSDLSDGPAESSESPATSIKKGSFNWDRENGWTLEWAGFAEFEAWLKEEQLANSIEFVMSRTKTGKWLWAKRWTFVCSRQISGGQKEYDKKHPDSYRKVDSKKTGCHCQIEIKFYYHTITILGRYVQEHDHEIRSANIAYTRLSQTARDQIKVMLKQKVDQKEIVRT